MTTFALIHGAFHGGWCWESVIPGLERAGHRAVAPDLPIEDPGAGALAYARIVADAIGDAEDVVVVGHSLGGLVVPVVAALRPVRRMVFVAGLVPRPGTAFVDEMAAHGDALQGGGHPAQDARSVSPPRPFDVARERYYHDVPVDVARRAWARQRPQAQTPMAEACPLDAWPDVPSSSVVMTDDHAVSVTYSRHVAAEVLRTDPIELPGSHSPFLSRPAALAEALCGCTGSV
ncbi:MAG: alpha/beta fold hydrolase [Baekduiaceae bacterium]